MNRKRDSLGLRKYIHGTEREESVLEWWETVKGNVKISCTTSEKHGCKNSTKISVLSLTVLIDVDHPPLSVLIEALRKLNYEARAALKRLQEDPNNAKELRKRVQERRAKIAEEIRLFEDIYRFGPNEQEIERFCRKMSRYVTGKAK
ncbi:unnamed protein product [Haemonchus placei]|uniref:Uncharacterized protein n=1 Tax=Haemonchus placei TaxID=6290 RepID=A0A3P7YL65_HAEPC|nr:unnamed protein product [Haemonchus placei]